MTYPFIHDQPKELRMCITVLVIPFAIVYPLAAGVADGGEQVYSRLSSSRNREGQSGTNPPQGTTDEKLPNPNRSRR